MGIGGGQVVEIEWMAVAIKAIGQGPGLVAKFCAARKKGDERPGYARFTTWNEPATFVPLETRSTDDSSLGMEETEPNSKWKESCVAPKLTTSVF
jgi:hypothetical protein